MFTTRPRTAVLVAAIAPLGLGATASAQFAATPITADATNNLPADQIISIEPAGAGLLTYTNQANGTLFNGIRFRGDVRIVNEAGRTGLNDTGGGIATGIFQDQFQSGTLDFLNEGFLNGSIGTSSNALLGGDDTVTILTTGSVENSIALGVGNDLILLTGGEADSAPGAGDGDRFGSLFLNGVFDVETLQIDGQAGLTGDDRPQWFLLNGQSNTTSFTEGVEIGVTQPVVAILSSNFFSTATIRTDADSAVVINNGSDFIVNGRVDGNVTANSGGTLAPRGFAVINRDLDLDNGSIFELSVNADASGQTLEVLQDVNIGNATLDLVEQGAIFGEITTIEVLTAEGTVNGNFTNVTTDFTFLTGATTVNDGVVSLVLTRNGTGISNDATTENQRQAGLALEVIDAIADPVDSPDNEVLANAYAALGTPAAQQAALDSLSGEALASAPRAATYSARGFSRGMDRRSRMMQVYLAEGDVLPTPQFASSAGVTHDLVLLQAAAASPAGQVAAVDTFVPGFWLDLIGGDGDIDANDGFAGMDYDFYGLIGGVDIQASNEWIVGASVGYTTGDYDVADRSSSGDLDTINLGAYTAFIIGNWRINGGVGVAFDSYDSSRVVSVGTFNQVASADYDGDTYSLDATATYRIDLEDWIGTIGEETRLEPFACFEYFYSETEDYSESGAGSANLAVDETDFDALYTTLGARLHRTFILDRNTLTPEVRAGWQREWLDTDATTTARFLGAGVNSPITVTGVNPEDDAALLGAGLTADFNRKFSLRIDYDTRIASDQTDQQVTLSLRIPW